MAITFKYRGVSYTADTPKEADEMLALVKRREAEAVIEEMASRSAGYMDHYQKLFSAFDESKFKWTSGHFTALIDRLGEAQKLALALLVTRKSVADEELRNALKLSGNQALAGVLSGISKQAAALYIPARAIFDFENFRVGGKRRSDYLVVDEFRQIAAQMKWPPPALLPPPA